MTGVIVVALLLNALAHVVSFRQLQAEQSPNAPGVGAFVAINTVIAVLLILGQDWAKWLALVFPAIGGAGLFVQTISKGKASTIDWVILVLDVILVVVSIICLL